MIRLPTKLFALLLPVVFVGSCRLSLRPIWEWQERAAIHPVGEAEKKLFPVLARAADGRYLVAQLEDSPTGVTLVTSVARDEEMKINRDLGDSIGWVGDYRYFQILSDQGDAMQVSLEVPTKRDAKMKGWYSLKQGSITPQKIVSYGPGFAFSVLPWSLFAGLFGVVIYLLLVRRKKKPNQSLQPTGASARG